MNRVLDLNWYVPNVGQLPFHLDRGVVCYRLLSGGTGSGKTLAGVFEDVQWCLFFDVVGCVFEPTFGMIKRNLIPAFEKLLGYPLEKSPVVVEFNKAELRLDIENRLGGVSRVWMVSLDNPESAEGTNLDFAHPDEARLVPQWETAWQMVLRRLRGTRPGNPVGAWVTTTPNDPFTPLHNFFENPKTRNPDSKVYRVSIYDNAENLPKGFIKTMEETHTGPLAERFIWGRFATVGLGKLGFDYAVHVQGYVQPYEPRLTVYGVDFGWTSPTALLAVQFDGDGRAYVIEEIYQTQMDLPKLIEACRELEAHHGPGVWWCDRSEPATIRALNQEGLLAVANPTKREDGIKELGTRLKVQGDGRARLYMNPQCVNTIQELQLYDPDAKTQSFDHATDALRYALINSRQTGPLQVYTAERP